MKYDVFISYSRDDKALVLPFVEQISKAVKRDCWMDMKGIESGVEFEEVIMKAIDECQIVLFMLSDSSLKSSWTKREVYYAESQQKRIVPVLVNGEKLRGWFQFHFGNVDYINIRSKEHKEKLMSNLRDWLGVEEEERKAAEEAKHKAAEDQKIAPYAKREDDKSGVEIHIDVDADCDLFRFKTFIRQLKAGEDNVVYLNPGKYKLEFVSAEFPEVKDSKVYEIAVGIECDFMEISLKDKVEEKRRAAEEEEHQKKLKALENIWFNRIEKDGKWGFADVSGKVVIPCKWKDAYDFSEGLAAVKDDNEKYGFIDKTGMVVIPCKWKWAGGVSEDLAPVMDDNEKCGYIDKTGKVVIPCQWENAGFFQEGFADVKDDNGKWWKIDRRGKIFEEIKW